MFADDRMRIKFWGVRGSYPVSGASTLEYGGNTPCVEVEVAGRTIILDAGTGIIPLGRDLLCRSKQTGEPVEATLLLSHLHHDHTQGFPFFSPAFVPSTRLFIFGPQTFQGDLEHVLVQNMLPPVFPVTLQEMNASKEISGVTDSQLICLNSLGDAPQVVSINNPPAVQDPDMVWIQALRSYAHPGGVFIYRISWRNLAVVYATDTEGYAHTDRRLVNFACNAHLLIHDTQYTEDQYLGLAPGGRPTQGWGHSTASMACEVAHAAGVGRLALFHYDPGYNDTVIAQIEAGARRLYPDAFAAREEMEVTLSSDGALPQVSESKSLLFSQPVCQ